MENLSMLKRLSNAFDQETKDRLFAKASQLSPKGQKKLNDKLCDHHHIIVRKPISVRVEMIDSFMDDFLKVYPLGCDDTKNLALEASKKPVVSVEKKTGVVKEYESVRAASRESHVDDGSICFCCQNMAGTHIRKGYKSAGGFKWYFKEDWLKLQNGEETKE